MLPQRAPFQSPELVPSRWPPQAAWGCCYGRLTAEDGLMPRLPPGPAARPGPWWVGRGHKVDAREVLGGPGARVGPQMGRAGSQGWCWQPWGAQI